MVEGHPGGSKFIAIPLVWLAFVIVAVGIPFTYAFEAGISHLGVPDVRANRASIATYALPGIRWSVVGAVLPLIAVATYAVAIRRLFVNGAIVFILALIVGLFFWLRMVTFLRA